MYDPNEIAQTIAEYQEQIENIEKLITELRWLPVFDVEGNVISYADWEEV
jgi:hypothetical protein